MAMIAASGIGYALVGMAYVILAILLATNWRGHRLGFYLIGACLANAAWGLLLAWNIARSPVDPFLILSIEIVRTSSWVVFLAHLAGQIGVGRTVRAAAVGLCGLVLVGGLAAWASFNWLGGSGDVGQVLFPGGLAIALVGLLLVEQLYRNSPPEARWGLKALVLGVGGIFAFDLFLYSQAVLFTALDSTTWAARGFVNIFFVPAIAIAARRNPDWELRVFVSRHVVFYTTTLVAVGAYLLVMSFGGYLLIRFGGSWGALARVVFFAGAILVLLVLLFSSVLRSHLRVFLSKHFFHNKYDYREEWMRLIDTLADFEQSSTREVAVKAVAQVVASPAGVLWVFDESESKFLLDARHDYEQEVPDLETDDALLAFVLKDNWVVDLAEFERDSDRYEDLVLPDWTRRLSNAWLFVPLTFGLELLGLIMLTRSPGLPKLNYEDRDLIKTVANHVAVHLAQARSDRMLVEARQFEAYNKLTAFLMHDLNNLIAQQSLIVSNADEHKHNPEFVDDAVSTIAGSVERMKRVMEQLKRGQAGATSKSVELRFLVSTAIDRCNERKPQPDLNVNGVEAEISVNTEEFVMILTHLIRNAQDATRADGEVAIRLGADSEVIRVEIRDTGEGMSRRFIRDRLFRPFDSTKGNEGMGIGAYQAREFARSHGGDVEVSSEPGRGTTFVLSLPRVRA